MKFTPGPWEYCEMNQEHFDNFCGPFGAIEPCVKIGSSIIKLRCFVLPGTSGEEIGEWKANANLMAAAPDMYEALKFLVEAVTYIDNEPGESRGAFEIAVERAEAALTKAVGRKEE